MNDAILMVNGGSIGEQHRRCFRRSGQVEVAADNANAARQSGVASFSDFNTGLCWRSRPSRSMRFF